MRTTKNWLALLLVSLLVVSQGAVAFAEGSAFPTLTSAYEAGREISFSAKGIWHEFPLIDPEINSAITSMLEAMEIKGRLAMADKENSYSHLELLLDGTTALDYGVVYENGTTYQASPLLGSPVALAPQDIPAYLEKLGAYLDAQIDPSSTTFKDLYSSLGASFASVTDAEISPLHNEEMVEMIAAFNIEEVSAALSQWAESAIVPEAYEGELVSAFDVETESATLYSLTKQDLMDLINLMTPILKENSALWDYILDSSLVTISPDEDAADYDADALKAEALTEIQAMLDSVSGIAEEGIPDNLSMYYLEGHGKDNETVLGQLVFALPEDTETGTPSYTIYLEWLPGECAIYAYAGNEMGKTQLTMQPKKQETLDLDGVVSIAGGYAMVLNVEAGGEVVLDVVLEIATLKSESDNKLSCDTAIVLTVTQGEAASGVSLDINDITLYDGGEDLIRSIGMQTNLFMNDAVMPLFSLIFMASSGEPAGAPFDPSSGEMTFVNPGQMDDEAFEKWIEEDVAVSAIQAGLMVLSLLPTNVFSMVVNLDL